DQFILSWMPRNRKGNRHETPRRLTAAHASLSSQYQIVKDHGMTEATTPGTASGSGSLPYP
ncbi:hypothetical protein, partial [Aurantimonas sp. C2-3-R2]|uniref:hypothetical protein n=1 Tax=Aurantimonas sp. C2-3-R2 TaxID=3114363 RepID=UPI002E1A005A|nr:hypothetical protein [Aurantimonas sp. C2-3-R2]